MNKKIYALAVVLIVLGLILSACTRSATNKGPNIATATSEIPFPVGTLDTSARVTEIVQQTQNAISTPFPTSQPQSQPTSQPTSQATSIVIANTPMVVQPTAVITLPPIPTATRPATYALQEGEWPICIARRYNLDLESFLTVNDMTMDSQPSAGTVLKIPSTGTWAAGSRALKIHPTTYTVKTGDTIYSIGCSFGDVDPQAIIIANNLQSPYTLTAGTTIQIP